MITARFISLSVPQAEWKSYVIIIWVEPNFVALQLGRSWPHPTNWSRASSGWQEAACNRLCKTCLFIYLFISFFAFDSRGQGRRFEDAASCLSEEQTESNKNTNEALVISPISLSEVDVWPSHSFLRASLQCQSNRYTVTSFSNLSTELSTKNLTRLWCFGTEASTPETLMKLSYSIADLILFQENMLYCPLGFWHLHKCDHLLQLHHYIMSFD